MSGDSCLELRVKVTRRPGSFGTKLTEATLAHALWLLVPGHVCLRNIRVSDEKHEEAISYLFA